MTRKTVFLVESKEDLIQCPSCDGDLRPRDRKLRSYLDDGRVKRYLSIRRLKCVSCGKHHNELPDMLSPYKHYKTTVIEDVIMESEHSDELPFEDYPCEGTMERWVRWIARNITQIDGYLRSITYRILDCGDLFLKEDSSLLRELQKNRNGWLGKINRIIYNSGGFMPLSNAPTLL